MKALTVAAYLSLALMCIVTFILSLHGAYSYHMFPDIFVFRDRANYLLEHGSLAGLQGNEYQPGALLYFFLLSPWLLINNTVEMFAFALGMANMALLGILAYYYKKMDRTLGIILLSLSFLFLGPIYLFRFDIVPAFLTVLAIYFWKKDRSFIALALLSLGIMVKVYPIIFLPYFLMLSYKNNGLKKTLTNSVFFGIISIIYLVTYLLVFQIDIISTEASLNFHNMKSAGLESIWANLLTIISVFTNGTSVPTENVYGINAIDRRYIILPIAFYNNIWILPFIVLHIWYWFSNKVWKFDILFCIVNLLLFLFFAKVYANQYFIWFLVLLPLLNIQELVKKSRWIITFFLLFASLFLHQFIFPLNFSEFLDMYRSQEINLLFYIILLSNIFLGAFIGRMSLELYRSVRNQSTD